MHVKPEALNSILRDVEVLKATLDSGTHWMDVYSELCGISEKIEILKDLADARKHF